MGDDLKTIDDRICSKCHKTFGPGVDVCPDDRGRVLVISRSDTDRVGDVIDAKVTILGLLGKGGMGSAYRALQHTMEREVAVKLMKSSLSEDMVLVKRFLREAKTASKLNHPNIITLFDFGQTEKGELYLMMELLRGVELTQVLAESGPMNARIAVDIILQV